MGKGKVLTTAYYPDGHIVTAYTNGIECTCGKSTSYLPDFGPLVRKYIPCEHIRHELGKQVTIQLPKQEG